MTGGGVDGTENDDNYKVNTGNVEPHRDMFFLDYLVGCGLTGVLV